MRRLFINSPTKAPAGDFHLWDKVNDKPVSVFIGNYIEVVLCKILGVVGQLKTPGVDQEIRGYELEIQHSMIHPSVAPEMVRFECPSKTVDALLRRQRIGQYLKLRTMLVNYTRVIKCSECPEGEHPGETHQWYVIAVDGEYFWDKKVHQVPHSNYEALYGKRDSND